MDNLASGDRPARAPLSETPAFLVAIVLCVVCLGYWLCLTKVYHFRNAGDAYVVRDRLQATVAHTYEWNLHAPVTMTVENPQSVKIVNGAQSVCVRSLNSNASFAKWTGPAAQSGTVEDHGAFYMKGAIDEVLEVTR